MAQLNINKYFCVFYFLCFVFPLYSFSLSHENQKKNVYIFFDQNHSYIEKNSTLIISNHITINNQLNSQMSVNINEFPNFCKNIFYFSSNKINFYNPSKYMKTSQNCEVQLTDIKNNQSLKYNFVLNKTFAFWCEEKDTNIPIRKTIDAIVSLFKLDICNPKFSNLLENTKILNLANNQLEDISPISSFLKIRSLWLDNNQINDIDALGSLHKLVFLSLNNNYVNKLTNIEDMNELRWFFIKNNQIEDVNFVRHLKKLKLLDIDQNLIVNPFPFYEISTRVDILANDNPFMGSLCHFSKNSENNKAIEFLKNCLKTNFSPQK